MLFSLILLQVFFLCCQASEDSRPAYLTAEDFERAANLELETTGANFSMPSMGDDTAFPETKLAWKYTKWDGGVIPYTLDKSFTEDHRSKVAAAMQMYHSKTCVRFVPRGTEKDYVYISKDDTTCGVAQLCRQGGEQFAKFGGGCISPGVMAHELGHTMCFMHEQTRPDRDEYINWDTSKCKPHDKVNANDWTTLDLLYDYVSLQHYEGECYNGCIKPKMEGVEKCGSGGPPSVLDVEKINAYYDCPGCYSYRYRAKGLISYSANDRLVRAGNSINGEDLYPCRAYHNGDIIPGKGDRSGNCWVSYNFSEHRKDSKFEVLSNPKNANLVWRSHSGKAVPANAIAGGRTATRNTLYVGRCYYTNDQGTRMLIPGKFHPDASPDHLYIPYGGREIKCQPFELLFCN